MIAASSSSFSASANEQSSGEITHRFQSSAESFPNYYLLGFIEVYRLAIFWIQKLMESIMRECIYCGELKAEDMFTMEHVIPQCLGGAYAPEELKTRDVCKDCNSNLGLFVDASFEKNHLVSNILHLNARAFFDPADPTSLPLCCHGYSDLALPGMTDAEVCELWLGPFGESVYWVRPKDERLYWYAGGNPRTVKQKKSRAYFFFTEASKKNLELVLLSFRDAFRRRKVRKISCTTIEGFDIASIGFSEPDDLDHERVSYLLQQTRGKQQVHGQMSINVHFDQRFMSKLALGLSHVLFDKEVRNSRYSQELRKALWFRLGDPIPAVRGITTFSSRELPAKEYMSFEHGVTLTVCPVDDAVGIILSIGRTLTPAVMCAEIRELNKTQISHLGEGFSLILFDSLQKCVKLTMPELVAHNLGMVKHSELSQIEKLASERIRYFQNL